MALLCPELLETRSVLVEANDVDKLSAEYNDPFLFEDLLKIVRREGKTDCLNGLHRFFPVLETDVHRFLESNPKYHGYLSRVFYTLCNQHLIMGLLKTTAAEFRQQAEEQQNTPNCLVCEPDAYVLQEEEEDFYLKIIRDVWVDSQTMCRERGLMQQCRAEIERRLSRLTSQLAKIDTILQNSSLDHDIHTNGHELLYIYRLSLAVINLQHKVMIYTQLSKMYKSLSPSQEPLKYTSLSGWLEISPNSQVLVTLKEDCLSYQADASSEKTTLNLTEFSVRPMKKEGYLHLIKEQPKKLPHSKSSSGLLSVHGGDSRRNSAVQAEPSPKPSYTRLPTEPPFLTFRVTSTCRFNCLEALSGYLPEGISPIVEMYMTPEWEEVLDTWASKILQNIRMAKLMSDTRCCINRQASLTGTKDTPALLADMMVPHYQALEEQKQELSFLWARRLQETKQNVDEVSYALEILSKQCEIIRTMNFSHQRVDIVQQALNEILEDSDSESPVVSRRLAPNSSMRSTMTLQTPLLDDSALPVKVNIPAESAPEGNVVLDPYIEFPYARVRGTASDGAYYQPSAFAASSSRRNSYTGKGSACGPNSILVPHDHEQDPPMAITPGCWVRVLRTQGGRCLCVAVPRSGEFLDGRELWKSSFRLSLLDANDLETFPWLGELRKKLDGELQSSVSLFIENYSTYLSNRSFFHQKSRSMREPLPSRTCFEVTRFALSLDDHLLHLGFGCFRAIDFVDLSAAEIRLNKLIQNKQEVFHRAAETQKSLGERFVESTNYLAALKQRLNDEKELAEMSFEQCKLPLACLRGDLEWTTTQLQSMNYDKKRCRVFVNQPCRSGHFPLLIAAQGGYLSIIDALLEAGCNPLTYDKHRGWTALHYASMQGHLDVVKRLVNLEITESAENDSLFGFIKSPKGAKSPMKDSKLVMQRRDILNLKTEETGDTVLHIAVCFRRHNVVEWLLANAADPNIQASAGLRQCVAPLHDAVRLGDTRSTELLITYGASVTLRIPTPMDLDPSSVFLIALCHQHQEVVDLLVARGYGLCNDDQNRLVEWCRSTGHDAPLDILAKGYQSHIENLRLSLKAVR